MHRRIVGAVVAVAVVGGLIAIRWIADSPPDSYAYITAAKGYSTCTNGDCHNSDWRCTISALLPRKKLDRRPAAASPELLRDAFSIRETLRDSDDTCDAAVHTWVGARFDSSDPSSAQLVLPSARWFSITSLIRLLVAGVLIWAIWQTLIKRKAKKVGGDA